MHVTPRRIAAAALVAGGLTFIAAPAAHAVVDPVAFLTCAGGTPADLTALVDPTAVVADPASLAAPPEIPAATHCLAP
ncbi:hypothetical protein SAMN05444920_107205 [Nonomuraea solani]|uniref:Uncharacterized protein n=1 Tax=Nonomuraea solani TaxID=1144553 RepID=A0A1H6E0N6_9ACTN|nr:hypothetical protein [Nonomuraea solani]SEG91160.1 hypothetical protein SAMN05444920_107205 [Nonomuraea solani]